MALKREAVEEMLSLAVEAIVTELKRAKSAEKRPAIGLVSAAIKLAEKCDLALAPGDKPLREPIDLVKEQARREAMAEAEEDDGDKDENGRPMFRLPVPLKRDVQ